LIIEHRNYVLCNLFDATNFASVIIRVDSIMLLDEGFHVMSTDASDKMLKYALRQRWLKRKQPQFDSWGMNFLYWSYIYTQLGQQFVVPKLKCLVQINKPECLVKDKFW